MDAEAFQDEIGKAVDCIQALRTKMGTCGHVPSIDDVSNGAAAVALLRSSAHGNLAFVQSCIISVAPINRIPVEVLSVIFSMASLTPFRPGWPRDPEGQYQSPRILHEHIMQVCRHWWGVAQSTASLWSDIILRPRRELGSAQIQQARTTSVNVYCEGDVESLVPVLSEHAHRIRSLHIRTMDCSDSSTMQRMDAVFMILPRMALHIEEFVLHTWYVHWPMISKERPIVSLFSGHAPRLRVLSVFYVRRMLTGSFPNLRKLYLIICGSPIATEVLDFLRESPMLEHIHLEAPGVTLPDGPPNTRVARLPHLREIVLSIGHNIGCLLSHIVLPSSCLVGLQDFDLSEVPHCLEVLERQLDARELTKLSWSSGPVSSDLMETHWPYLRITLYNAATDAGLQLGILMHGYHRDRDTFAAVVSRALYTCPLYANVTELSIFARRHQIDFTLLDSLRSLTTINHIFAAAAAPGKHCGPARRERRETPRVPVLAQVGPDGAVACPNLHTLYFIGCGAAELRDARDILQARREAGRALTRLGIDCSARLREEANALRALVDELDVAITDEPGYEELKGGESGLKGGWHSHSARARYEWPGPQWPESR